MLPRLESLGLRGNDLDCLPVEELSHMRMLRTVRIDGNPWLCECRLRLEKFFRERSIVQEEECKPPPGVYLNLQCMTHIDIPIRPPTITIEQIGNYEVSLINLRVASDRRSRCDKRKIRKNSYSRGNWPRSLDILRETRYLRYWNVKFYKASIFIQRR